MGKGRDNFNALLFLYNGQPVSMTRSGVTYYYHYNAHGDTVALTDGSGNVAATYMYDIWGNITSKTGDIGNPYTYGGQFRYIYDSESRLYFLKTRYYNPEIGRFISRDRFAGFVNDPSSQNRYVYCQDDPIDNVDSTGYAGINKTVYYWWGVRFYLDNNRANTLSLKLNLLAGQYALVAAACTAGALISAKIAACLVPTGWEGAISGWLTSVAVVSGIISAYFWTMSASIAVKNSRNSGVILDISKFFFIFKVYRQ